MQGDSFVCRSVEAQNQAPILTWQAGGAQLPSQGHPFKRILTKVTTVSLIIFKKFLSLNSRAIGPKTLKKYKFTKIYSYKTRKYTKFKNPDIK